MFDQRWKNQFFRAAKLVLNGADSALISSETTRNNADFLWIQDDIFQFTFLFFWNISKYLNFESQNSDFQPTLLKRIEQ